MLCQFHTIISGFLTFVRKLTYVVYLGCSVNNVNIIMFMLQNIPERQVLQGMCV